MKKRNKKILTLVLATSVSGSLLAEGSIITKAEDKDESNVVSESKNNDKSIDMFSDNATTGAAVAVDDNNQEYNENVINEGKVSKEIAKGKTATASTEKQKASLAVDGDDGTRWESEQNEDPQWIAIDLNGEFTITGVKLKWETAAAKEYKIQVSKDGEDWDDVSEVTDGVSGEEKEITFDSEVTGRYIRMYGTERTTQYGYSLFNFEVYGYGNEGEDAGDEDIKTDLSVVSTSNKSVSLKWSPIDGAAGYNVYKSSSADGDFKKINENTVTDTAYTDSDLVNGTCYYKISAVNAEGKESKFSEAVKAMITADIDLGENVKIFDPSMSQEEIQSIVDDVFNKMETNQFGTDRYALMFKPGKYNINVNVGFYTSVMGLGQTPDDVDITGSVHCEADWFAEQPGNATQNFWRIVENLAFTPKYKSNNTMHDEGDLTWAVSQAAPMRRVHVKGNLSLWDPYDNGDFYNPVSAAYEKGWASGGFIADTKIDGTASSASQQQFFNRNNDFGNWDGSNWNMVFVGDKGAPQDEYVKNGKAFTTVDETPVRQEKPFIYIDNDGEYKVFRPSLSKNTQGISWENGIGEGESLSVADTFYIAKPDIDSADSLNEALSEGKNILFTPGVYKLDKALHVTEPDTVILGIGLATLNPVNRNAALEVDDVDGVSISGLLFNAAQGESPELLKVGEEGSDKDHSENPITLNDLFFRVGGDGKEGARADSCIIINSNNVVGDDFWVWRADHGDGVGWELNRCNNGLVVNGDDVTIYGLFVEHFNEYQTIWNGENGKVYFYQSEMPYDVPNQESWMSHDGTVNGYASYKVADSVKNHELYGSGVYTYFTDAEVVANSGIEVPDTPHVKVKHACNVHLNAYGGADYIVNNSGEAVDSNTMRSVLLEYCNKVGNAVISPATGMFTSSQTVSISCPNDGAVIRYTTDGTDPTETNGNIYTEPFKVDSTTTIKAVAYKEGMEDSEIANSTLTVNKELADDLSFGKTSSSSSGNASYAFDGNPATRWESDHSDDQYISVDLGAVYDINKINFLWEAAYGKEFEIQVSNDGENWTKAYVKGADSTGTDNVNDDFNEADKTEKMEFTNPVTGRYVKMQGVKRATEWGYSLYEFEVYGQLHKTDDTDVADKSSLQGLYDSHKADVKGNYTDETWNAFAGALNTAKDVLDKDEALEDEISAAYNNLTNTVNGLKEKEVVVHHRHNSNSSSSSSSDDSSTTNDSSDVDDNSGTSNEISTNTEKKSGWNKDDSTGKWYMYDKNTGDMIVNWFKDSDEKWYYLDSQSGEMKTGWYKDESTGKWYMLDNTTGVMVTGWFKDSNGKWYYLESHTGEMKTGWFKDSNGYWYYLYSDGSMAYDTYINGYYVSINGAWIQ